MSEDNSLNRRSVLSGMTAVAAGLTVPQSVRASSQLKDTIPTGDEEDPIEGVDIADEDWIDQMQLVDKQYEALWDHLADDNRVADVTIVRGSNWLGDHKELATKVKYYPDVQRPSVSEFIPREVERSSLEVPVIFEEYTEEGISNSIQTKGSANEFNSRSLSGCSWDVTHDNIGAGFGHGDSSNWYGVLGSPVTGEYTGRRFFTTAYHTVEPWVTGNANSDSVYLALGDCSSVWSSCNEIVSNKKIGSIPYTNPDLDLALIEVRDNDVSFNNFIRRPDRSPCDIPVSGYLSRSRTLALEAAGDQPPIYKTGHRTKTTVGELEEVDVYLDQSFGESSKYLRFKDMHAFSGDSGCPIYLEKSTNTGGTEAKLLSPGLSRGYGRSDGKVEAAAAYAFANQYPIRYGD